MIHRIPKKYREKYAKPKGVGWSVLSFALKIFGPVVLFFVVAVGLDVYSLIR